MTALVEVFYYYFYYYYCGPNVASNMLQVLREVWKSGI